MHVPLCLRERYRPTGKGAPIQKKYERDCFEKNHVNQQPVAAFVCPGHPLLEAALSLVNERYGSLMKQGAVMVDEADAGDDVYALFLLEHSVRDGLTISNGKPHVLSEKLQFAAIDRNGNATDAGIAPHLNLRPAKPGEIALVEDCLGEDWWSSELEKKAIQFATIKMAQSHLAETRKRRLPEIDKVEREVRTRLQQEIRHWEARAFELKEQERAGRKTHLNCQNAERRTEELTERLNRRMQLLQQERFIFSQPPRIRGGMIVFPRRLLAARSQSKSSFQAARDAGARRQVEPAAMEAVMNAEKALGNEPSDVSAEKVGYDIASFDPETQHLRFIEVKGRVEGADTLMLTRQEVITSLHEPEKYILAIVEVGDGPVRPPRYVRGPLSGHEPGFDQTAIQFSLKSLLDRSESPT